MGLVQGFKGLIVPNGVSLNASTASVQNGGTYQLIPYITPSLSKNKKVHWSSNNNNVTVDDNGLVTGVTDGTSIVTATTDYGNYTSSCTITVYTVHVTGVSLNTNSIELSAGDTYQLTATVNPSNATNKNISRRSTDASVATVSSTGLVTCVSGGNCQIIVTTEDGNYTATCNVIAQNILFDFGDWINSVWETTGTQGTITKTSSYVSFYNSSSFSQNQLSEYKIDFTKNFLLEFRANIPNTSASYHMVSLGIGWFGTSWESNRRNKIWGIVGNTDYGGDTNNGPRDFFFRWENGTFTLGWDGVTKGTGTYTLTGQESPYLREQVYRDTLTIYTAKLTYL